MATERREVIVIGGGLSGLSAAVKLYSEGVDVIVLEANNRLGGRLHTIHNDRLGNIDLGGAYVGPTQDRVLRVAKELGVNTQPVQNDGEITCFRKGKIRRFRGILPPMGSVGAALDANHLVRTIHQLCEDIPLSEPWIAKKAYELDSMSFQEFLDQTVSSEQVKDNAKMLLRLNMTSEPYEVSLLWTLWYIKSAGGYYRMNAFDGGAQERTFVGGSQQLPIKLAERLPGRVFINQPVVKISQNSDHVVILTTSGDTYEADHVIIAAPPAAHMKMVFEPPLPTLRNQLIQRVPHGSVVKCFLFYEQPHWRNKGLSGTTFIEDDDLDLPIVSTIDYTKADGSSPAICGFIAGEKVRLLADLTKEERKNLIAKQYAKIFECEEMLQPIHYEEKNWCEDVWSGGCYTGYMAPGVLTSFGRSLREPIGRIYFAGTETATKWSGYMDGAVEAGERAAREVLCELGKCKSADVYQQESFSEIEDNELTLGLLQDSAVKEFPLGLGEKYMPSRPVLAKSLAVLATLAAAGAIGGKYAKSKL